MSHFVRKIYADITNLTIYTLFTMKFKRTSAFNTYINYLLLLLFSIIHRLNVKINKNKSKQLLQYNCWKLKCNYSKKKKLIFTCFKLSMMLYLNEKKSNCIYICLIFRISMTIWFFFRLFFCNYPSKLIKNVW